MPLNKFEHNIRNKFENRRMNPSDKAWDKLESKLDRQKSNSTNARLWMAIAASFLLGALISGLIISHRGRQKTSYYAQEQQKTTNTKTTSSRTDKKLESVQKKSSKARKPGLRDAKKKTKASVKKSPTLKKKVVTKAGKDTPKPTKPNITDKPRKKSVPKASGNLKQHIAENSKNYKVTDAETENLLRDAQSKIRMKSANQKSSATVDANMLLHEVETGKDKSLKEQIFKTVKDKLHKFKVLLASRY